MPNFSDNGNSSWFRVNSDGGFNPCFTGTFGTGTVTFQVSVNGNGFTLLDHDNADAAYSYTADFSDFFNLPKGTLVRAVLSGATSPDIDYEMNGCTDLSNVP